MANWDFTLNSCEKWKEALESDQPHLQHLKKINPYDYIDKENQVILWNKFSNTIEDLDEIMPGASWGIDESKFDLLMTAEVGYGPFGNN